MNEDVFVASRRAHRPTTDEATHRANQIGLLMAGVVGVPALVTLDGLVAFDLAVATWMGTFLSGLAIAEVMAAISRRRHPSIELAAGQTMLTVAGARLQLATLKWTRQGWADLILADGDRRVHLEQLEDRTAVERFLDAHIERSRSRHGAGEDEVPAALKQQRTRSARTH